MISVEVKRHRTWPCFKKGEESLQTSSVCSHELEKDVQSTGTSSHTTLTHEEILDIYDSFTNDILAAETSNVNTDLGTSRKSKTRSIHEITYAMEEEPRAAKRCKSEDAVAVSVRTHERHQSSNSSRLQNTETAEYDMLLPEVLGFETNLAAGLLDADAGSVQRIESMSIALDDFCSLVEFQDVSDEEVIKVKLLRKLTKEIFQDYWKETEQHLSLAQPIPELTDVSDISGDVRLLRTLRLCGGDIQETVTELQGYLKWRRENGLEQIRLQLLTDNLSLKDISVRFALNEKDHTPFYSQMPNGDIVDLFVLRNLKKTSLVGNEQSDALAQLTLWEFRSIVADRLSYARRRIIMFKLIVDCPALSQAENGAAEVSIESKRQKTNKVMCWDKLKLWGCYLTELSKIGTRWHAGIVSKLHLFGSGCLFKFMAKLIGSDSAMFEFYVGLGGTSSLSFAESLAEKQKVLTNELGSQLNWPPQYGGINTKPFEENIGLRNISAF